MSVNVCVLLYLSPLGKYLSASEIAGLTDMSFLKAFDIYSQLHFERIVSIQPTPPPVLFILAFTSGRKKNIFHLNSIS